MDSVFHRNFMLRTSILEINLGRGVSAGEQKLQHEDASTVPLCELLRAGAVLSKKWDMNFTVGKGPEQHWLSLKGTHG